MENDIPISRKIAEEILAGDAGFLEIARTSVFCMVCFPTTNKSVAMRVERYELNDLGDIILEGNCEICHGKVARYIESGENPKHFKTARKYMGKQ